MRPSYYLDIVMKPGEEFPLPDITNELYRRLHILFADAKNKKNKKYAISFPEYKQSGLGKVFRIFTESEKDLYDLRAKIDDLRRKRFYGCLECMEVLPLPLKFSIARYSRIREDVRPEKRIARLKKTIRDPEVLKKKIAATHTERHINCPYARLYSSSTSSTYPLYINKEPASSLASNFNCFGFPIENPEGGVPEF